MPPQEDIQQSFSIGDPKATSAAGAALTMMEGLGRSLGQIIHNPAAAITTIWAVSSQLENHLIKNLKEGVGLTKQQQREFEELSKKARHINMLSGAFASLTFKIAQSTIELRKASLELSRFANLSNLPGGSSNPLEAARYMREKRMENTFKYNSEFAASVERNEERLHLKLPKGLGGDDRKQYIKDLAAYSYSTGTDASQFIAKMLDKRRTFQTDDSEAKQILDQIMVGYQGGKFGASFIGEVYSTYLNSMEKAIQSGIRPEIAKTQSLKALETLGSQPSGSELGIGDIDTIMSINAQLREGKTSMQFEAVTGQKLSEDWVENFRTLQKYIKSQLGDTNVESAAALLMKDPEAWAKRFNIAPEFGITSEIFNILAGPAIEDMGSELSKGLQEIKSRGKYAQTDKAQDEVARILDGISGTKDLLDIAKGILDWSTLRLSEIGEAIGLEPYQLQLLGLGVAGGGAVWKGKKILGKYRQIKKGNLLQNISPKGLGTSSSGGLIINPSTGKPFSPSVSSPIGTAGKIAGAGGKLLNALPIIGGSLQLGANTFEDVTKMKEEERSLGEAVGMSAVKGYYKYLLKPISWGKSISDIFKGKNVFEAFDYDITDDINKMIYGRGKGSEKTVLKNQETFEKSLENKQNVSNESDNIPKIRVMITDSRDMLLADKIVSPEGKTEDIIRVSMGGVVRGF